MKRVTIVLLAGALLAGCMTQQPSPPLMPAELRAPTPPPVHITPDPLDSLSPAIRQAYLTGSTRPIRDGITIILPYSEHARPTIYTSPLHVTEIVLGQGERLTNTAIGDSDRFAIEARANNILIKPTPPGHQAGSHGGAASTVSLPLSYSTNLIAITDKRTYHFIVQSTPHTWMEQVTFWFPDEIAAARVARANAMREAARQAAQAPTAEALNFNYKVSGPDVAWKPIEVFSDRSHTYITFNDSAALAGDLPALFAGSSKEQTVVNYTSRGSTFIADRVLTDAALTEGQGANRQVVRIESTDGH